MAYSTGARLAAAFFLGVSFLPPWIHAFVTFPIGVGLWRKARENEREAEQKRESIAELTEDP